MNLKLKLGVLGLLAVGLVGIYLFHDLGSQWEYALTRRSVKIAAILLTGTAIALSTTVFQTITHNRILTPSIIGLDSLYMLIQTFLIFVFGSVAVVTMNKQVHFLLSVGLMVFFAGVLYRLLFSHEGRNLYFILLVGLIFGTFFQSVFSFMQMLMDPNEFMFVQDRMFASFNNVRSDLLGISTVSILLVIFYSSRLTHYLDVLSLGKDHAINLGVPYDAVVKRLMVVIAVLVSVSTALVGPITFLGLLVANVAREFMQTYRHNYLLPASVLAGVIALVGAQLMVERIFTFSTTISVIVNFIGGVYFIFLLLRVSKSW